MEVCESKFCVLERESLLLRQQMADIVIAVGGVGCGGWCCGCDIQISPVSSPAGPCSCAVWAVISSLQRATVTSSQRLAAAAASHRSVVSRPLSSEHLAWPGRVTSQSPSTPFSLQYFPLLSIHVSQELFEILPEQSEVYVIQNLGDTIHYISIQPVSDFKLLSRPMQFNFATYLLPYSNDYTGKIIQKIPLIKHFIIDSLKIGLGIFAITCENIFVVLRKCILINHWCNL